MLALLMLTQGPTASAPLLAMLTSFASPVAGAFLALVGVAWALSSIGPSTSLEPPHDRRRSRMQGRGLALAAAALTPILGMSLIFPEGGWQPFSAAMFWPVLAGVMLTALALPRLGRTLALGIRRPLTYGVWLYALALIAAFALRTPVGDNALRLGALLGAPLVVGALWRERRLALALLAPALLYWQLEAPISDVVALAGTPSVTAAYYTPLVDELQRLAHDKPLRVEVPPTEGHWESVYLPEDPDILLARGWERQLDTRYNGLFYRPGLSASTYRSWLSQNAVSYVALPDTQLDVAGEQEGQLIKHGLPYLEEVWHSAHWRLFAARDSVPLAQAPAVLTSVDADSFTLRTPRRGTFTVRLRFTPYWTLLGAAGTVEPTPGGWTEVHSRQAGIIRIGIEVP
jgi:hypothetical protein